MNRLRHSCFVLLAFVSLTFATATGHAKPRSLEARFRLAQKLHDADRCDKALPLFEELVTATKSPNARLYVARCLKQLGRIAEAFQQLRKTTREARTLATTEPRYVPTRDAAAAELAILEPMVGRLLIRLTKRPPGLTLQLNGRALELTSLRDPVAASPGPYKLKARAPGHAAHTYTGTLKADELATLDVDWRKEDATPNESPSKPLGGVRIGGIAVTGLGLAGLAAFSATAVMAKSEFDSLSKDCGGAQCPPEYADRVDKGRTLQTVANISLVVGSVATLAGGAMIIFGGEDTPEDDSVSFSLHPYPLGLKLRGRF